MSATHRWSGWPGAICQDCLIEDPVEACLATNPDCACVCMDGAKCVVEIPPCPSPRQLSQYESWNSSSAPEMLKYIGDSGMPLTGDEQRLIAWGPDHNYSVYGLHSLNMLCYMASGYRRNERGQK